MRCCLNIEPAYCFGFGLSYTEFKLKTQQVSVTGDSISVSVDVTNTGGFKGRDVIQVYISAPAGEIDKPYQELKGFKKTKELRPGETERLVISFRADTLASYSESKAAWVLEKGNYYIRVGENSRKTKIEAVLAVENEAVVCKVKNLSTGAEVGNEWKRAQDIKTYSYPGERDEIKKAVKLYLDTSKIKCSSVRYGAGKAFEQEESCNKVLTADDVLSGKATLEELVSQLTPEELAELCVGAMRKGTGVSMIGDASLSVPGAAGETTSLMVDDRNIRSIVLADGPAGLRLTPVYHTKDGKPIEEFHIISSDMKMIVENMPEDAIPKSDLEGCEEHYQYCTALPIAMLLGQTWDVNEIKCSGDMIGTEMEEFGITLWLAPGMNIYRNPLCGRNFEYFSENPLLSGMCAAACTNGVQSHKGVGTTIKHFACNNQEDNRGFNNSHVSERALREIYLKGFEICVKSAQPMAIMTSYNLVNGIHAANHRELLTSVLRDEWGFRGLVMTDWGTTTESLKCMLPDLAIPPDMYPLSTSYGCMVAGNDLIMPGSEGDVEEILSSLNRKDRDGKPLLQLENLQQCAERILKIILCSSAYEDAKPYGSDFEKTEYVW